MEYKQSIAVINIERNLGNVGGKDLEEIVGEFVGCEDIWCIKSRAYEGYASRSGVVAVAVANVEDNLHAVNDCCEIMTYCAP